MAKQRAFANQEREAQAQRLGRWGRAALMAVATLLSFATVALLVADRLYRPDAFVIDQLKIKGSFRHLQPSDVEAIVADVGMGNFFSVELADIKAEIEGLSWVQTAQVRREWPNSLLVTVKEHRPVMRWNNKKWVNSAGEIIDLPGKINLPGAINLRGPEHDSALMLKQAVRWKQRLSSSGLELRELELSGSHAWTLIIAHVVSTADFELLLGRQKVDERLSRFQFLFDKQFKQAEQRLERVDARYPDGLAIKVSKINHTDTVAVNK